VSRDASSGELRIAQRLHGSSAAFAGDHVDQFIVGLRMRKT